MRHKEINVINVNPSIKFAVDFGLALVTEKMKKRIHFYTSLDQATDLDKSLMPQEYGGTMPMKEMIGSRELNNVDYYCIFIIIL